MRHTERKIDCDYYDVRRRESRSIDGIAIVEDPVCLLKGSPNDPPTIEGSFEKACGRCEHNQWQEAPE